MTRFGWTPIREVLKEPNIRDIAQAYYAELWNDARVPCNPDWERRIRMEDEGSYKVWTATVDGTLAGFIEFQLTPTLNSRDKIVALDCGHFLAPAFRGKDRLWWQMWRSAERAIAELGGKSILAHDNIRRPLMAPFLSLGYKPVATLYWKAL